MKVYRDAKIRDINLLEEIALKIFLCGPKAAKMMAEIYKQDLLNPTLDNLQLVKTK
jgi:hypothetical protein